MENNDNLNALLNSQLEPKLSYSNMVNETKKCMRKEEDLFVQGNNYKATFGNKGDFIYVKRKEGKSAGALEGLKFHVSVDPLKMDEAWKIVMNVMAKYGVREAKIANPLVDKPQEAGKEITIYAFQENPSRPILKSEQGKDASWEEIIGEITIQLRNAGIQPGAAATSNSLGGGIEHAIKGTNYITWRDDFNMMENVKTKIPPEEIPRVIDDNDLDTYFETVNLQLDSNKEEDMDYKKSLFKYYHDNINSFNQLGHNLNERQIVQVDRLPSEDHVQRRENKYIEIRDTPIIPERKKQTFGSGAQILQGLTSPSDLTHKNDKMTIQSHENEVGQDNSHMTERKTKPMTERKLKGLGGNFDFIKTTPNKRQENLFTPQNFSTTKLDTQQNTSQKLGTTKKKDLPPIPSTQSNFNSTQTVQDNDFRRRLEKIVAKQKPNPSNQGSKKQEDLSQTDTTQTKNDSSNNPPRFNPFSRDK